MAFQCPPNLVPVGGGAAMLLPKGGLDCALVSRSDARQHFGRQMPVQMRQEVVALRLVVGGVREQRMPAHRAIVRGAVIVRSADRLHVFQTS